MARKYVTIDRHYLYQRQSGTCFFCGKSLKMNTLSVDHYLPKGAGGTNDVFNLVASCKTCNAEKHDEVPEDVEARHIEWFIQAYENHHLLTRSNIIIPKDLLSTWIHSVKKAYASGPYTVFEAPGSPGHRFYVRLNQIEKVIAFDQSDPDL